MSALQIPFNLHGDLLQDNYGTWGQVKGEWKRIPSITKENYIFDDTLELLDFHMSRSSVIYKFQSLTDGKKYRMFHSDFMKLILSDQLKHKRVYGSWTFCKRGPHYGIKKV